MEKTFLEKVESKFGKEIFDEYEILGTYETYNKKIEILHKNCNTKFMMRPNDFLNGHRCPECARKKRAKKSTLTLEKYKEKVEKIFPGEYEILSDSITKLKDKIKIKHISCGNIYEATARNLLRGMGCKKCAAIKSGLKQKGISKPHKTVKSLEQFKLDVLNAIGPDYEVIGEYITSNKHIKIRHKCGYEYDVLPHNIISHKTTCPKCVNKTRSKEEQEVLDFIKSIYTGKIEINIRDNGDIKYEIDIYLPDLNIGIEYDGLYFHSDKKIDKHYHRNKMNYFYKKGIRLINIFEDEWLNKKEIVKTKLKNILGVSNSKKIFARKTIIKDITKSEKDEFLKNYHIQGEDTSSIKTGLFYNDELVAVMTFVKPNSSKNGKGKYQYELSRYATKYNIVGGFSKLLKYCITKYNIESIGTFADLRWSSRDSNVYEKNGFKLEHISKPNYWYIPKNTIARLHRVSYQKKKLKKLFPELYDDNKTEIEIMKEAGYNIIYDCGNLVYKMEIAK